MRNGRNTQPLGLVKPLHRMTRKQMVRPELHVIPPESYRSPPLHETGYGRHIKIDPVLFARLLEILDKRGK